MSYRVGIDFGATFTAAAVHRDGEQAAELVPLGDNRAAVASVAYVAPDGSLLLGDAAARQALTDPDGAVREVKRRIGDETPLILAGEPIEAHTIAACFIRWVVDRVAQHEGEPPAGLALTYPASWDRDTCALWVKALAEQEIHAVRLVPEPAAAAFAYAATRDVAPGDAVGVYDLGGGTFDAAIVRRLDTGGFRLVGRPEGIDFLGGADFDDAVLAHVKNSVGALWTELDLDDPEMSTAAAALLRECAAAKEALSTDAEVTIPVMLPGLTTRVRMTRTDLEQLVAPAIAATAEVMRRACSSAGLRPQDLSAVLLTGGSSRIPLVAHQVSQTLDRPVTADADPKALVARGAVLSIAPAAAPPKPVLVAPVARPRRRSRRGVVVGVGLAACLAALAAASTLGSDLLPSTGTQVDAADQPAGLPREIVDRVPIGTPKENTRDPWTGRPYEETTRPGPHRPGARPADASPAELSPSPTTGGHRNAQIAGEPPSTQTVGTATPTTDIGRASTTAPTDQSTAPTVQPTTTPPTVTTTDQPAPTTTEERTNTDPPVPTITTTTEPVVDPPPASSATP
ncbi:Hsp70 family protein [Actinophytocola sp.]|uniref:Hsp70 family protein n=1 Tax=Actinophytocola sp. TaxID=1872138 RepID=UPI002ED56B94